MVVVERWRGGEVVNQNKSTVTHPTSSTAHPTINSPTGVV